MKRLLIIPLLILSLTSSGQTLVQSNGSTGRSGAVSEYLFNSSIYMGHGAGYTNQLSTYSFFNILMGDSAGYHNWGNSNTMIGARAGYNNYLGNGNIFLGYRAGENETRSNRLYIDNNSNDSITAFVFGNLETKHLYINGSATIGSLNPNNSIPGVSKYDLQSIATFGYGSGQANDTSLVSTNMLLGSFKNLSLDTLIATEADGFIVTGSGTSTIAVTFYVNTTINTGTATTFGPYTYDNTSDGNNHQVYSISIPPGSYLWAKPTTVTAGNKPSYLSITVGGYKR